MSRKSKEAERRRKEEQRKNRDSRKNRYNYMSEKGEIGKRDKTVYMEMYSKLPEEMRARYNTKNPNREDYNLLRTDYINYRNSVYKNHKNKSLENLSGF